MLKNKAFIALRRASAKDVKPKVPAGGGGARRRLMGGPLLAAVAALITCVKILLIPAYRSTDFEVHRNWLAITHSLPRDEWYYEKTSEWTLDYPPLFAWFECALSYAARLFDERMLVVSNLNYASEGTVLFQRLSVIASDLALAAGAKRCCDTFVDFKPKLLIFMLIFGNAGLLMVDHIHFQYNGILFGILLLSVAEAFKNNYLMSAFYFSVLLNMKHIYLYVVPAYVVYLFRSYCFTLASRDSVNVAWYSFSPKNLMKLAGVVVGVCLVSFGPFYRHIPQIVERLFPFKRGLSHAYWAPNFWALYNIGDKICLVVFNKLGYKSNVSAASMTGGLVQEYNHAVLPKITPMFTFLLTFAAMLPALIKLWRLCADKKRRPFHFLRCLTICAGCSFMFGWHVHEKAILIMIIPLSLLAALDPHDCRAFLLLSTVGHYSLFPLLHPAALLPAKACALLAYALFAFAHLPTLYACKRPAPGKLHRLPMLNVLETAYLAGLAALCAYEHVAHPLLGLQKALPFLPLMATSAYCAVGVAYAWLRLYANFLAMGVFDAAERKVK